MRNVILIVIQLIISLLVVGAILPAVLYGVAAARSPRIGVALTGTIVAAVFIVLRLVWPQTRRD